MAEEVVEQGGCAEAVAAVVEPGVAEGFLDGDEELQRLFRGADAAGGFHGDFDAGGEEVVADGIEHDLVVAERGIGRRSCRWRS